LNLRTIKAIGFDMDYTLVHYHPEAWELHAYRQLQLILADKGWPVADLEFDPEFAVLGLVLDLHHGNIVKANRFGYIKKAFHGTKPLSFEEQRELYARTLVDLAEPRWRFLNVFFSLSEACMYAQLVDRLDQGRLVQVIGYADLHRIIRSSLDEAHMEGTLKNEIISDPEKFVELDPDLPMTLMDFQQAGKKLMLITNADWSYTEHMMAFILDSHLPGNTTWKDIFELVIVQAKKPTFFSSNAPIFKVVNERGHLESVFGQLKESGTYVGGNASLVEEYLGLRGDQILYVGDHIFSDVQASKSLLRWRTALVLRDLESEIDTEQTFCKSQVELTSQMQKKEALEQECAQIRVDIQRVKAGYGPTADKSAEQLQEELQDIQSKLADLDQQIAPLAQANSELHHERWGLLMRTGNDKSTLARKVESHADIYTSRVSNLRHVTPFGFIRSSRGSLPHDCSET
jgi:HAD superfamily 5'-nucleotidase-like hydrolase